MYSVRTPYASPPKRPRRAHARWLILGLIGLVILVIIWWLVRPHHDSTPSSPPGQSAAVSKPAANDPHSITFIATGDMLPHQTVDQAAKTDSGYDYAPFFQHVHRYLTSGDMAYCNQESPSDPTESVSGYPTFNAPASFARALSDEGCNIINLANNHANDRHQAGINATRQVWDNLPSLAVAGTARSEAEQNKIAIFTVKGMRFAFLSYAQCSNDKNLTSYGVNILSKSLADRQLAAAKKQADMIIVGIHSCDELHSHEDSWQDHWAQYFADQGVDIVVGTGPHWLQPVKRLPKAGGGTTVVWFSLGNFLSTQEETNGLFGGIAAMTIDTRTQSVTKLAFLPTYMHYEWTAAQKAHGDLLARHNLMIYPLDQAAGPLAHSQTDTTVAAQTSRITQLLNQYTPVTMLTSQTFPTR